MDAAREMFREADAIQHTEISIAQWADGVEAYQRSKLMADAVGDLVDAWSKQSGKSKAQIRKVLKARADSKESEMRDELQGTLELLGGGDE